MLRSALDRAARGALANPRWVVAAAAALVFANTLHNMPVMDDGWVIFDNPLIKHLNQAGAIFREPYGYSQASEHRGLFRPLTTLTYALNWAMGGLNVTGYHLANIGFHILCCFLVLELGIVFGRAAGGTEQTVSVAALLGALLFAVHPVHVEAVTAMVGRDELLAALGVLVCLYLTCTRRRAPWRYPVALFALAAGVLGKENAAVGPLLFLVIAIALPGAADLEARPGLSSAQGRQALWRMSALAAGMVCAVGFCVLLRPAAAVIPVESRWFGDLPNRVVFNTMTRVLAEYLQLLVFPVPLGADFYYSKLFPPTPTFTAACLADTIVWGAVLVSGVVAVRRAPLWTVGVLWIFVALLPVLNIVRIGVEMAERLLYLPSVGFCLVAGAVVAGGLERLRQREPQRVLALGVMGVVGLLLAAKTWTRNTDWRNNYTFWRAEVRRAPQDPIPNNYLALEYMTRGEFDSAGAHLVASLTAAPGYWDANLNMGLLAHKLHQDSVAATWLARAHQLEPMESDPLFFLGVMRGDEGRLAEAIDVLAQAESLAPTEAWTRVCRGWYLERLGKRAEGNAEIVRALELDPAVSLRNCVATARP